MTINKKIILAVSDNTRTSCTSLGIHRCTGRQTSWTVTPI